MNMRKLRERAGLRAVDVAFYLGINESTVRNWEKGRTVPKLTIPQMRQLLDLYKCSFEELEESLKESMPIEDEDSGEKEQPG